MFLTTGVLISEDVGDSRTTHSDYSLWKKFLIQGFREAGSRAPSRQCLVQQPVELPCSDSVLQWQHHNILPPGTSTRLRVLAPQPSPESDCENTLSLLQSPCPAVLASTGLSCFP
jgi:hypothetical protein